jgi:hypothetical protein
MGEYGKMKKKTKKYLIIAVGLFFYIVAGALMYDYPFLRRLAIIFLSALGGVLVWENSK